MNELQLFNGLFELCPSDFQFYITPRPSGHGGGFATVFENIKCHKLTAASCSTFEQLLKVEPWPCALVYRPPKAIKNFIEEFMNFLGILLLSVDRI